MTDLQAEQAGVSKIRHQATTDELAAKLCQMATRLLKEVVSEPASLQDTNDLLDTKMIIESILRRVTREA